MDRIWMYAAALLPSIGVLYLFYVIIKSLLEGDRNERIAMARLDKADQERAASSDIRKRSPPGRRPRTGTFRPAELPGYVVCRM